ncbi:hypothetical protein pb186bvf_007777 [Paramecium bursaria]
MQQINEQRRYKQFLRQNFKGYFYLQINLEQIQISLIYQVIMIKTVWFRRYISKMTKKAINNISLPNQNLIDLISNYRQIKGENNKSDWKTLLAEKFQGSINLENLISELDKQIQVQEPKRIKKDKKLINKNQKQNSENQIQQYLNFKSQVQCNGFPIKSPQKGNQINEIQNYDQATEPHNKQLLNSEQKLTDDMLKQIISQLNFEVCNKCNQIKEPSELLIINQFVCCSQCCLDGLNPLAKITRRIKTLRFVTESNNHEKKYRLEEFDIQQGDQFEIRCIQISQKGMKEMTFPHNCVLRLNGCVLKYFQPLYTNDSISKRHDKPVIINKQFFEKYFAQQKHFDFRIEQIKSNNNKVKHDKPGVIYEFSIYITKNLQKEEIIQNAIHEEIAENIIQDQQELQIVLTKVSLACCFTNQIIKVPAKGLFCTHYQCFCLENFIDIQISNNSQKWLCPICKSPLVSIMIDQKQLQALKLLSKYISQHGEIDLNFISSTIYQELNVDQKDISNEREPSERTMREVITID